MNIPAHARQIALYDGYIIYEDDITHREEDNIKTDWYVEDKDGNVQRAPVGPYDPEAVYLWIDAGCPTPVSKPFDSLNPDSRRLPQSYDRRQLCAMIGHEMMASTPHTD